MKMKTILSLFLFAAVRSSSARSWVNIVDSAIFMASAIDYGRLEKSLERDPFDFTDGHLSTQAPTRMPSKPVEEAAEFPTLAPTVVSESPTLSPTGRYENIVSNGGCPVGKNLYEIRMTDSWGDGWEGIVIRIEESSVSRSSDNQYATSTNDGAFSAFSTTSYYSSVQVKQQETTATQVFKGRLSNGSNGHQYACLRRNVCYTVEVDGGTWQSEIEWEVREIELGVEREKNMSVAKGATPETCQFSIKNFSGDLACPVNCGLKKSDSPTREMSPSPSTSPSPTTSPTARPSGTPSSSPTLAASTQVPTSSPSDAGRIDDEIEDSGDDKESTTPNWNRSKDNDGNNESDFSSDSPSLAPSQQL